MNANFEMAQILATLAGFAVIAASIYYTRAPPEKDNISRSSLEDTISRNLNLAWG